MFIRLIEVHLLVSELYTLDGEIWRELTLFLRRTEIFSKGTQLLTFVVSTLVSHNELFFDDSIPEQQIS